jgi:hypothetical protein
MLPADHEERLIEQINEERLAHPAAQIMYDTSLSIPEKRARLQVGSRSNAALDRKAVS